MKNALTFVSLILASALAWAAPVDASAPAFQDHALIREAVAAFLKQQTTSLPGTVDYQIDEIDRRIRLTSCGRLETFLPAGSQLIGKLSVGVRCTEDKGWSILVPVQVKLTVNLLTSMRPLPTGHILTGDDITIQTTASTNLAALNDPRQAVGKVLRYSIMAGQILREDMLRPPYSVLQGQTVQLALQRGSFSVQNEGVALNNAGAGQAVNVRTSSGRVISGTANEGGVVAVGH
jgi:flagellar basal body P-ring formation protein FlgA